ncbi:MAG: hypothetical protein K0S41_2047 [Anaerocolumna sp.]|jgi:ribosomal protein L25 (general stress protein Ctc)|nr:hypothetical protein [Anaerocolumna sp.]
MKEGLFTKPITKQEAKYLRKNGYGWAVICGHGTYNQYLVVEDDRYGTLKLLKKYHDDIRTKTVTK